MKLRFKVDQAACLRRGIDCPKSIVTIEVNPAELSQEHRDILADRLQGIDLYQLTPQRDVGLGKIIVRGAYKLRVSASLNTPVVADGPTYSDLIAAVEREEEDLKLAILDQIGTH